MPKPSPRRIQNTAALNTAARIIHRIQRVLFRPLGPLGPSTRFLALLAVRGRLGSLRWRGQWSAEGSWIAYCRGRPTASGGPLRAGYRVIQDNQQQDFVKRPPVCGTGPDHLGPLWSGSGVFVGQPPFVERACGLCGTSPGLCGADPCTGRLPRSLCGTNPRGGGARREGARTTLGRRRRSAHVSAGQRRSAQVRVGARKPTRIRCGQQSASRLTG